MTTQEKALWQAIKAIKKRLGISSGGFTPTAHAPSHVTGSTDPIDILTLDGYPNSSPPVDFLREDGTWATPSTSALSLHGTVGAWLVTVGDTVFVECPYAGTIIAARIAGFDSTGASLSGSAVVGVWKDTLANYPPTIADTIAASAKPTLTSDAIVSDTTLPGWTTSVAAGDWFAFPLESMSTIEKVLVQLTILRS